MTTPATYPGRAPTDVTVAVKGLSPRERQLLEALVRERDPKGRALRLAFVGDEDVQQADALLVDADDPGALVWASLQGWPATKPVIWLSVPAYA